MKIHIILSFNKSPYEILIEENKIPDHLMKKFKQIYHGFIFYNCTTLEEKQNIIDTLEK